jgi:hypothetical protein
MSEPREKRIKSAVSDAQAMTNSAQITDIDLRLSEIGVKLKYEAKTRIDTGAFLCGITIALGILLAVMRYYYGAKSPDSGVGFILMIYFFVAAAAFLRFFKCGMEKERLEEEAEILNAKKNILKKPVSEQQVIRATPAENVAETDIISPTRYTYFDKLVEINLTNLEAYYSMVKAHANNSFIVVIYSGILGFLLIITGLCYGFFWTTADKTITYIAAGSGVITEFISGIFFYIYNKTVGQLKDYHDSLLHVQNVLLSFKLIGDIADPAERAGMLKQVLDSIMKDKKVPTPVSRASATPKT